MDPTTPPPAPKKTRRDHFVTLCNDAITSPTRRNLNVPVMDWHFHPHQSTMLLNTVAENGFSSSSPASSSHGLGNEAEASLMLTDDERKAEFRRAQAAYPQAARLFVGNLTNLVDEDVLAQMVEHEFSQYGECFVDVDHTVDGDDTIKPYALIQYTRIQTAEHAMSDGGKEKVIEGRKVRLEWSHAARRAFAHLFTYGF